MRRRQTVVESAKETFVEEAEKEEIFSKAAENEVVAKAAESKVDVEEPKSTYNGCFAVKDNADVLTTHVNCNLKMSNKVRAAEILILVTNFHEWYAGIGTNHVVSFVYTPAPTLRYWKIVFVASWE